MAKSLKKLEAIKLRRKGMSIKTIAAAIGMAPSTVSIWCRDIILSKKQEKVLYEKMVDAGHKGRMMGAETNKRKKLDVIKNAASIATKEIRTLSVRDVQMLALGLYWGEGSKDKQGRFVFVNSDPIAISLIILWLTTTMKIETTALHPQIYINDSHRERESIVKQFWSKKLKLPVSQFGKTIFVMVPHKKIYDNHDTYMGVLHLTVSKSSTLKYQTMALLEKAQEYVQKI